MPTLERLPTLLAILLFGHEAHAQPELPVLRANSPNVLFLEGGKPMKGEWIVDPKIELDIYDASRSDKSRTITVKTDLDSKIFDVEPGHVYDFVVLLNGKDACKNRISTMRQGFTRVAGTDPSEPVTIPISIENGKLHLKGRINDSQPLDLLFDTGADGCVMYPSAKLKGVAMTFDKTALIAGGGTTTLRQVSTDNRLSVADVQWTHEPFIYIEVQADKADGIVGYTVFEDKVVEIDYDRMVMVVRDALPAHAGGFAKTDMPFAGTLTAVEVTMTSGDKTWRGPFVLDTAGTGTLIVNQSFASANEMRGALQKIGTGTSRGVGNVSFQLDRLMLPTLSLVGHTLNDVPIYVELTAQDQNGVSNGVLCMDVLYRFNTILDYPNNLAYFKPNARFGEPFRSRRSGPSLLVIGVLAGGVLLLAVVVIVRRSRAKRKHSLV